MRTRKHLSDALRFQIIDEYLQGASKYSLAKKYNLSGGNTITRWMCIFGVQNHSVMNESIPSSALEEELTLLKRENSRLKASLAYQTMRADAYDTLIDIAEKELHVSIRKKPGTKQSIR